MTRFIATAGVAAVVALTGIFVALGLPVSAALAIGCLVVGLASVLVGRRMMCIPVSALGYALLGFEAAVLAFVAGTGLGLNGGLSIAIALVIVLVAIHLVRVGLRLSHRRQRAAERRALAAERGWRFQEVGTGLAAELGGMSYHVHAVISLMVQRFPIRPGTQALSALHGEIGGIGFTVFDFAPPAGRLRVPPVATAWVVRLPHRLPLFTSEEAFRDHGEGGTGTSPGAVDATALPRQNPRPDSPHPDYLRALLTPQVTAFTREEIASWWITDSVLASVVRNPQGVPVRALVNVAERITRLASLLDWPGLARYALPDTLRRTENIL